MEPDNTDEDKLVFERTMKSLEAQIASAGAHLTIDTRARSLYTQEIKNMSDKLRADAIARRITWAAAAREAQEARNLIMGIIRARSTPVGRAFAEHRLCPTTWCMKNLPETAKEGGLKRRPL